MKSIKKILGLSLGLLLGMTAISCSEDVEYTPAGAVAGGQVYFAPASETVNPSNFDLEQGKGTFDITLLRVVTTNDLDVAITLTVDSAYTNRLSAPSVAHFNAGDSLTTVSVSYDATGLDYEEYMGAVLAIADSLNTTPYAVSQYEFTAAIPAPWTPWIKSKKDWVAAGYDAEAWPLHDTETTCTYTYVNYWSDDDAGLPIYYRVSLLDPTVGQFRVDNWGAGNPLYIEYNTADHSCKVLPQYVTDNSTYGPVTIADVAHWQNNDAYYSSYPCFYNPETGQFTLTVAWYVSAGSFGYAAEYIQVAGFYIYDYSVSADFEGVLTDKAGKVYAQTMVSFGADATEVKAYIAQKSDDAAAVADALASGDVEGIDVVQGLNKFPLGDATGELKVVVAVIADGEAKNVAEAAFEYYGAGADASPWKSLGIGTFTDDIVLPLFATNDEGVQEIESPTYEVEIKESTEKPGLYRVMNPYSNSVYPYAEDDCAEDGLFLEVDATDPSYVYILPQSLGFDWGYGEMAYCTLAGYYLANGYDIPTLQGYNIQGGVLQDGVIQFPVYQAKNGSLYNGYLFLGEDGYYTGGAGLFKIVLPSAYKKSAAKISAKKNFNHQFKAGKSLVRDLNVANKKMAKKALVQFAK